MSGPIPHQGITNQNWTFLGLTRRLLSWVADNSELSVTGKAFAMGGSFSAEQIGCLLAAAKEALATCPAISDSDILSSPSHLES